MYVQARNNRKIKVRISAILEKRKCPGTAGPLERQTRGRTMLMAKIPVGGILRLRT